MHAKKLVLYILIVAVVVMLAIGLAATRPSLAVTNATTSQAGGTPRGELSGGQYRLISAQPASGQSSENELMGGGYWLKPGDSVNDSTGCCCKNLLPCIKK
jgi:hypothetical protein